MVLQEREVAVLRKPKRLAAGALLLALAVLEEQR